MLHVFPHPLTRTATGGWVDFEPLRWAELPQWRAAHRTLLAQQQRLQAALDEALYQLIAQLGAAAPTAPLLRLKRAVFNGRVLPALPAGLPTDLLAMLRAYDQVQAQLAAWELDLAGAYEQALARGRAQVQALSRQPNLQRALPLASPTLLAQLPRYQHAAPAAFGKREQQTELGLLRYLTRLHFKTSPFSTFTAVSVSSLGAVPAGAAWPAAAPLRSVVRLNSYLLLHVQTLLLLVPGVAEALPLRLHPSCWVQEKTYHWLLNQRNLEAFQRLPQQPLVDIVAQQVQAQALSLRQLAERLAADHVEAPLATVADWLRQLVRCGFLAIDLGIASTDPAWELALTRRLAPLAAEFPAVQPVLELLAGLRLRLAAYPEESADARAASRQQLEGAFRQTEAHLLALADPVAVAEGRAAGHRAQGISYQPSAALRVGPYLPAGFRLLYEDTTQPDGGQLDAAGMQALVGTLHQALSHLPPASAELESLASLYKEQFGSRLSVPLLEFYQAYVTHPPCPAASPATPWAALTAALAAALPAYAAVVTLDPAQLGGAATPRAAPWTGAALVQLFGAAEGPALQGVVNNLLPGLGKGSGRFLHLFAQEQTHAQQAWNRRVLAGRGLATELRDASYSNANLHPPLLPHCLDLAGGPALTGGSALALSDLAVRLIPATGQASLWHEPSGQPVLPCDVALQALDTRAELYQFLLRFGPPVPTLAPLLAAVSADCRHRFPAQTEPLPGVFRYPRVQLGAGLVVRRRRWYVAAGALPQRRAAEPESQYLVRLAEWQQQLELPDEVFFAGQPAAPGNGLPASPDDYKPQYLHFASPLLVRLFEKQLRKGLPLRLEEMYPTTAQLRQAGQTHVRETLLEWGDLPG
jgi:hypothetical protein